MIRDLRHTFRIDHCDNSRHACPQVDPAPLLRPWPELMSISLDTELEVQISCSILQLRAPPITLYFRYFPGHDHFIVEATGNCRREEENGTLACIRTRRPSCPHLILGEIDVKYPWQGAEKGATCSVDQSRVVSGCARPNRVGDGAVHLMGVVNHERLQFLRRNALHGIVVDLAFIVVSRREHASLLSGKSVARGSHRVQTRQDLGRCHG